MKIVLQLLFFVFSVHGVWGAILQGPLSGTLSRSQSPYHVQADIVVEPGTQLTMRTFHIGGAASRAAAISSIEVKNGGIISLQNVKI